jgi:putative oxidoreductase
VTRYPTDAGVLLLRLYFGLVLALAHGVTKLPPSERFVSGVADMGFPAPLVFAWAAAVAEFGGGSLIAIGFMTRPAAALVVISMFVATFIKQSGDAFLERELAAAYLVVALVVMFAGSGRFGVDRIIATRKSRPSFAD